jgi:hypothetical protein
VILSFAILIARTFFIILRSVALSAALSVILAIAEILLMKFSKSNLYFRAVRQRFDSPSIRLFEEKLLSSFDGEPDIAQRVDDRCHVGHKRHHLFEAVCNQGDYAQRFLEDLAELREFPEDSAEAAGFNVFNGCSGFSFGITASRF